MDIEEWEVLSDDGLIDLHEDNEDLLPLSKGNHNSVIDMNYFQKFLQFDQQTVEIPEVVTKQPIESEIPEKEIGILEGDQETISKVCFNKLKENEFVDMKIDSPKSKNKGFIPQIEVGTYQFEEKEGNFEKELPIKLKENEFVDMKIDSPKSINKGFIPQIEVGNYQFEEKEGNFEKELLIKLKENEFVDMKIDSPKSINKGFIPQIEVGNYQFEEKDGNFEKESQPQPPINKEKSSKNPSMEKVPWEGNNGGLNIWKWAMTGIGALFSFGFAVATISVIVLGNHDKENHHYKNHQELHFQIYNHDKRIKQVVHHATKLNQAITAITGAPLSRANITIGGYYEGL